MSGASLPPAAGQVALTVPELAPSLGRLIVPRRLAEPWIPLDDIREQLVTRLFGCAGKARGFAQAEDRDHAFVAVGRESWIAVWEQAVQGTAERLADAVDQEVVRAAKSVRMPWRRWHRLRLSGSERRAVAARLASGGSRFVEALDLVETTAEAARQHPPAEAAWQEALLTAARRLEAAWLSLEEQVAAERTRWEPELSAIRAWRPALWPVFVLWIPIWAALIWLGLVLGGFLAAPAWLAARLGF